jgi:hypothetical protein
MSPWRSHPAWRFLGACSLLCAFSGCAAMRAPTELPNPLYVRGENPEPMWNELVDVVDDYFEIGREQRVRIVGDVLTEGVIDTRPQISATLLEPWLGDSIGGYQRLESTLQSMRRRCLVRVMPADNGYLVDVAVFRELEDVPIPDQSPVGGAIFRSDTSLDGYSEPVGGQAVNAGWIGEGRDCALEQRILCQLQAQLDNPPHGWFNFGK